MEEPRREGASIDEALLETLSAPRPLSSSSSSSSFATSSSIPFYGRNPNPNPLARSRLCSFQPSRSAPWIGSQGQKRSMFIQTQSTPNPLSLMFYPGKPVMEVGSADFPNARTAMNSPLAKSLFGIDGVTRVFLGSSKAGSFCGDNGFLLIRKPLFLDSNAAASLDTAIHEDDSEIVAMIKELLETRIRPAVQDDGGDIEYRGFDPETGIVKLRMQGACSGCPSSSVTLKSGIENMLMHYVPEVKGVEQELDSVDEEASLSSQME
uniref:Scaffold protein Nfu/NifU N-terminal domain-containing protein n=1 Tax=Ananas comosus var. bracteatus TaxID=296719 RepID=A0A6V7NEF8_ANACO|nr:unnamed protein product [Ananas comosus var. bracteatus]